MDGCTNGKISSKQLGKMIKACKECIINENEEWMEFCLFWVHIVSNHNAS